MVARYLVGDCTRQLCNSRGSSPWYLERNLVTFCGRWGDREMRVRSVVTGIDELTADHGTEQPHIASDGKNRSHWIL